MINRTANRVLVCVRYGIGDVVMEMPVLESLRHVLPHAHITALGARPATELLERTSVVDEVVELNRWGFSHRWDPGPPEAAVAIGAWLDTNDFDLILNVSNVTTGFGDVVRHKRLPVVESSDEAERAAIIAGESGVAAIQEGVRAGWGLHVPLGRVPRINVPHEERRFAATFMEEHGFSAPVAISPVASNHLKRWPLDRLARIADELVAQGDQPLITFFGPDEQAMRELSRGMRRGDMLIGIGPAHLERVAALLEQCRAFLCNDTGLMHIAAAVGVPTLAVFGPTDPATFRPPRSHVISLAAGECAYRNTESLHPPLCLVRQRCLVEHGPCIQHVETRQVRRQLLRLLEAGAPRDVQEGAVA